MRKASRQLTHQEGICGGSPRPVTKLWASRDVQVGQVTPALKGLPVSWEELGLQEAGPAGFWNVWWLSEAWSYSWETGIWPQRARSCCRMRVSMQSLLASSPPAISSPVQYSGLLGSGPGMRVGCWSHWTICISCVAYWGEGRGLECWALYLDREELICPSSSELETASPALDYNPSRAKSTAQNSLRKAEGAV